MIFGFYHYDIDQTSIVGKGKKFNVLCNYTLTDVFLDDLVMKTYFAKDILSLIEDFYIDDIYLRVDTPWFMRLFQCINSTLFLLKLATFTPLQTRKRHLLVLLIQIVCRKKVYNSARPSGPLVGQTEIDTWKLRIHYSYHHVTVLTGGWHTLGDMTLSLSQNLLSRPKFLTRPNRFLAIIIEIEWI